jgi:alkylhydroperoxidase family enzyme
MIGLVPAHPRLTPPAREVLAPGVSDLLALASSTDGEPLGTIAVLAHRPQLVGPFLGWAAALALEGALDHRHHELLALRAAYRCHSAFEWGEHVGYGRQAGLTDDDIGRIAAGADAPGWDDAERALLRAVDELVDGCDISDKTWAALRDEFEPAALVEIPVVVGQYTMLSMVANGLGVPPVKGSEDLPAQ